MWRVLEQNEGSLNISELQDQRWCLGWKRNPAFQAWVWSIVYVIRTAYFDRWQRRLESKSAAPRHLSLIFKLFSIGQISSILASSSVSKDFRFSVSGCWMFTGVSWTSSSPFEDDWTWRSFSVKPGWNPTSSYSLDSGSKKTILFSRPVRDFRLWYELRPKMASFEVTKLSFSEFRT